MLQTSIWLLVAAASVVTAQTYQRLGTCPTLGCVFPPDRTDFLAGQIFDIRLEVHAPVNGSEASNNGVPNQDFTFTITKAGGQAVPATTFFNIADSPIETWNFTYFVDKFAEDAETPILVNVAAKAYRSLTLYEAGDYTATLRYNGGVETVAFWHVRDLSDVRRAKNVLLFIGDGMTTNMITAARLIAHKQVNGRYTSRMALDKFPQLGHQMTHSIDSFITDSANSATALYSGHKSTVNALGVYKDSSPDEFDDPKFETIAEIFHRVAGGHVGIVTTAYIADATPAGLTAHTPNRGEYAPIIDQALNGITNYSFSTWDGPDVFFGGGAEQFYTGEDTSDTYLGKNYYDEFANKGYNVVTNRTALLEAPNEKTLGIFCQSNLPVWLDRNIYTDNLEDFENDPRGSTDPALDLPGLKDMTLKAIDILQATSGDAGWFMMSEAASIDKQMHTLDYPRALGDLLELDDTVHATMQKLEELGILNETLVIVTADHGHGFDVMGSVDTKYLAAQQGDREKRNAIGTYQNSGLSQYVIPLENDTTVPEMFYTEGAHFPANWNPRYSLFSGLGADPDRREDYKVRTEGPREPATEIVEDSGDYYVNPEDAPDGFIVNGTLPVSDDQGVHSLTDVPVYSMGPCSELFSGSFNNIDIFFGMAECLGLSRYASAGAGPYTPSYSVTKRSPPKWTREASALEEMEVWWRNSADHWGS